MSDKRSPRLPDFICVGPPRTATTWLQKQLDSRTRLPATKETQFFVQNYGLGIRWYASHFSQCPAEYRTGEIAPTYFNSGEARDRIARHIPQCKIICTFRDPVARMYSHYRLWRSIGLIKADFDYVVFHHRSMRSYNRYAFHLKRWKKAFDPNVLVLLYDDFVADPQDYVNRIADFIGIARFDVGNAPATRVHTAEQAPRSRRLARRARKLQDVMIRYRLAGLVQLCRPLWAYCSRGGEKFGLIDPDLEREMRRAYRYEIEELEKLIGRDLSAWKNRTSQPGLEQDFASASL